MTSSYPPHVCCKHEVIKNLTQHQQFQTWVPKPCFSFFISSQTNSLLQYKNLIMKRRERERQSTEDLGTGQLFRMIMYWRMHVIMYLSKPIECTPPKVNPNVSYGFGVIMMCPDRFISCNKSALFPFYGCSRTQRWLYWKWGIRTWSPASASSLSTTLQCLPTNVHIM